jgi:hypothetical protein
VLLQKLCYQFVCENGLELHYKANIWRTQPNFRQKTMFCPNYTEIAKFWKTRLRLSSLYALKPRDHTAQVKVITSPVSQTFRRSLLFFSTNITRLVERTSANFVLRLILPCVVTGDDMIIFYLIGPSISRSKRRVSAN